MKKLFLLLIMLSFAGLSAQKQVAGVQIPETAEFKNEVLVLNGAGVREKFWIDLYAGGLYLQTRSSNPIKIINEDAPMAIKLHIVSGMVTSKKMIKAVDEGFENATNGNIAPISTKIENFKSFFDDEIKEGDIFDLVYIPGKGTIAYKNGMEKGTIEGMEFKKALFGIWLSKKPAEDSLKEAMLGN